MYKQDKEKLLKHIEQAQLVTEISMFGRTSDIKVVPSDRLVDLIGDLNKPVKVKQFVADWYEDNKEDLEYSIWELIIKSNTEYEEYVDDKTDMRYWVQHAPFHPIETLVRMKDGYEVEEEPKWIVKDCEGELVYDLHLSGVEITAYRSNCTGFDVLLFTEKSKADAVALLVSGEVEKV